ncbi:restriction endonuclease subunit S [Acinetobacter geminorum]|uniref:restriction endonuclease subunit S n=1 Tax=Acinetobacter geminorum TaxID=2730922 RepID=UPI003AF7D542
MGHRFQKDDVLFGKLRPYLAKVFLAQEEGLSSTEALVFRSSEVIYPKFLSYYCLSQDFINEVNGTTFGSKMPRASWDDISSFRMVYPSLDEQKIIADFLDKRLAQVDALIAKQETLLEKLAEQRVALISHAVTKGLNPHVEMKESKIRWVKDIPIHWNVVPVRYLFEFKNNQRIPVSAEDRGKMSEKIYPYYGASGIIDFVEDYIFDEDLLLVAEDGANLLSRSTPLAFKASGKYWVNNHAHIIKPVDNNLTYWEYVLALYDFTPLISGSAQPKLTKDNLASIKLPNPPDKEKHEICNFLDKPLENLKEQKLKIEKILETLKEYRSTLITQVVTGKIDVRNLKVN